MNKSNNACFFTVAAVVHIAVTFAFIHRPLSQGLPLLYRGLLSQALFSGPTSSGLCGRPIYHFASEPHCMQGRPKCILKTNARYKFTALHASIQYLHWNKITILQRQINAVATPIHYFRTLNEVLQNVLTNFKRSDFQAKTITPKIHVYGQLYMPHENIFKAFETVRLFCNIYCTVYSTSAHIYTVLYLCDVFSYINYIPFLTSLLKYSTP